MPDKAGFVSMSIVKKKFGAASELLPVTEISPVDFMQLQVAEDSE